MLVLFWFRSQGGRGRSNVWNKNNRNNTNLNTNTSGGSQEFNAYDYSMVDFRQFSGGAGRVQHIQPISTKYKAKVNIKLLMLKRT